MKDQFTDYKTAKMLKELGFVLDRENIFGFYTMEIQKLVPLHKPLEGDTAAPTWHQTEQWLWEKYKVWLEVYKTELKDYNSRICNKDEEIKILVAFDSPITAKTEGIKAAVKYLHEQIKK